MSDKFTFDDVFERGEKTARAILANRFDDLVSRTKGKSASELMNLRGKCAYSLAFCEAEPAYSKRMGELSLAAAQRELAYVDDLLKDVDVDAA